MSRKIGVGDVVELLSNTHLTKNRIREHGKLWRVINQQIESRDENPIGKTSCECDVYLNALDPFWHKLKQEFKLIRGRCKFSAVNYPRFDRNQDVRKFLR